MELMSNQPETVAHEEHEEEAVEHIHLPPPSWAPIILALGLTGVTFGVVLGGVVLIVGVVLLLLGIGMWVYDEIKHAAVADAEAAHAATHSDHVV
jgi:hypothetical protein